MWSVKIIRMNWYKIAQIVEVVEVVEEDVSIDRPSLENITPEQWQEINDRMSSKGYDFRGWEDTKAIYERLNKTTGGLPEDHREVFDAILEGKEYIKKEDPKKTKNIFNKAVRLFGLTNNLNEAGYILPNGRLLDFSGKKQGGPAGIRHLDHRDINEIINMPDFVSMGAIRHFPEDPGVNIGTSPTPQQLNVIWRDVENSAEGYIVELLSPYKGRFFEAYDSGVKAQKVVNDIKNFYSSSRLSFNFKQYKIAQQNKENKPKVFIIHGWEGHPKNNWFPWLKKKLESEGFKIIIPQMPYTDNPEIKPWVDKLKKIVGKPDENTYFIGHSIGCQTIMRYLQTLPKNSEIGGAIFVAGWISSLTPVKTWEDNEPEDQEIINPWLKSPLRFDKIKNTTDNFVAIFSDNDPYVPVKENSDTWKKELGAKVIVEHNKGHFDDEEGIKKLPVVFDTLMGMI